MLSTIQAFFDERIVQGTEEQRPNEHRCSSGRHGDLVPEQSEVLCTADHGEGVVSDEARRTGELELDPPSGLVVGHEVPHWAVSSSRAYAERAVEAHRGPSISRPKTIVPARE
jgi:hypothetical protein